MSGIIADNLDVSSGLIKGAVVAGGGKVLQVLQGTSSTESSGTETSYTDTGLNVTITCAATSSKVLVIASTTGRQDTSNGFSYFTIERQVSGGSDTNLGDATYAMVNMRGDFLFVGHVMCHVLDSPSTTSAITYELQRKAAVKAGAISAAMFEDIPSYIIAMEIGA